MIPFDRLQPYPADREAPSPNQGVRHASALQGVVFHATADDGNEGGSLSWMRSPQSQASCHLLVLRDGSVVRLVPDARRAWHAGAAVWRGVTDVNSITLGIEVANRNDGREPYTDRQYARLAEIGAWYCREGLTPADFVSHAEVAPGRKTDPLGFDWNRWRREVAAQTGLASPPAVLRRGDRGDLVREMQRRLGVGVDGIFGPATEAAVRAFQRSQGLTPDGIVGPQTAARLARAA